MHRQNRRRALSHWTAKLLAVKHQNRISENSRDMRKASPKAKTRSRTARFFPSSASSRSVCALGPPAPARVVAIAGGSSARRPGPTARGLAGEAAATVGWGRPGLVLLFRESTAGRSGMAFSVTFQGTQSISISCFHFNLRFSALLLSHWKFEKDPGPF